MSIIKLQQIITEPMRYGNLFLLGDAAHITPPSGAKGMSLALSDAYYLSQALTAFYNENRSDLLDNYSATALLRVFGTMRFTRWLTEVMHRFPEDPSYWGLRKQELESIFADESSRTALAESFAGLPVEKFE